MNLQDQQEKAELLKKIAGLKQDLAKARRTGKKYQALFEHMNDAAFLADTNTGKIIEVNHEAEKLTGHPKNVLIGMHQTRLHPENRRLESQKKFEEHVAAGRIADFSGEILKKDGTIVPVMINASVVSFADEKLIFGIFRDISHIKQAEILLKNNEQFLDDVFESIQDGISVLEPDLSIRRVNSIMNTWYAKQLPLEGKTCYECYHGRDKPCNPCPTIRCFETGKTEKEIIPGPRGSDVQWIELFSFPIKNNETGAVTGVVEFVRNITEQKKTEQALKKSEQGYRDLFEKSKDAILIIRNQKFVDCNQATVEMLGYENKNELLQTPPSKLFPATQPDGQKSAAKATEAINLALKNGSHRLEWENVRANGEVFPVEILLTTISNEEGKQIIHTVWRDITDRKQAEEERQRLQTQLNRAEKMETIGTLAGGVAHDLNNILGAIVGYPDLMLLDLPKDSPLISSLLAIRESGERAASIVQDLLTLARRGISISGVANLNTLIDQYLETQEYLKLKEFHPHVRVETKLVPNLMNIFGSPIHLTKVVMNLVSNAAEAMTKGGQIIISTENTYLDKTLKGYDTIEEGDYVLMTVSDNGIGIADSDLKRIFEPFYTKKVMGRSGTGLGMAVVWGTVKDHKGYIDVQSEEGRGTTFKLYFPVTRQETEQPEGPVPVEKYIGNGEKILIVDDVESQREIASNLLKKLNYSVITVSSGEKAVEHLKDNPVDLLVLDMIMDPGMDGLETYEHILKINPGQKAIIASGFSETDRVKQAQSLGAGTYIKKPYTLEKIGLAIKAELQKQS